MTSSSSAGWSTSATMASLKLHNELINTSNPDTARIVILRALLAAVDRQSSLSSTTTSPSHGSSGSNLVHLLCSRRSHLSPVARDDRDRFAASLLTVFCHIPSGDISGRALRRLLGMLVHLDADDLASPDDLLRVDSVTSTVLVTFSKNTPEAVKLRRNCKKLIRHLWSTEGRTLQFDLTSQAKGAAAQMLKAHVLKLLECIYCCMKIDSDSPRKSIPRAAGGGRGSHDLLSDPNGCGGDLKESSSADSSSSWYDPRMSTFSSRAITRQVSLGFICKTVAQATKKKFPDREYHSALCSLLFLRLVNPDILQHVRDMELGDEVEKENCRRWAISITKLIQAISNRAASSVHRKGASSCSAAIQLTPFQTFIESQGEALLDCVDTLVNGNQEDEFFSSAQFPAAGSTGSLNSSFGDGSPGPASSAVSYFTLSAGEEEQMIRDCGDELDVIIDWIRSSSLIGNANGKVHQSGRYRNMRLMLMNSWPAIKKLLPWLTLMCAIMAIAAVLY
eukprot:TRINITY_DN40906_c0_g1_i1.p1 TRINITY_DN40906_c0_g1~~TRINITY_DN40906_c0_g1_i1.p1  ORF type:complete len:506 (-),score=80.98 TRINITY_DN40906_c0_g1_i1:117-1634(-)